MQNYFKNVYSQNCAHYIIKQNSKACAHKIIPLSGKTTNYIL